VAHGALRHAQQHGQAGVRDGAERAAATGVLIAQRLELGQQAGLEPTWMPCPVASRVWKVKANRQGSHSSGSSTWSKRWPVPAEITAR
jgi:hypothetical protein